jgi:hypothetical protein
VARKRGGSGGERRVRRRRDGGGIGMGAEIAVEVELGRVGSGGLRGEAGEDGDWSFCKGLLGRRKLRESVLRVIPVFIYSIELCLWWVVEESCSQ